jgi:diacylglycerol kinase
MRIIKSFGYAVNGLRKAWTEQRNLRIQCWAMAGAVALGLYFRIHRWEWCTIILMGAIVISLELVNSAIENLTDLVTREQNPLAGKVKDISAAAVWVAAVTSAIIGTIIFGKHVLEIVRF